MYLREPLVIEAEPSDQAVRGTRQRTAAVWSAIERACEHEDFRPRPSALCNWCSFRSLCPIYGGDPARASEFTGVRPSLPIARADSLRLIGHVCSAGARRLHHATDVVAGRSSGSCSGSSAASSCR